MRPDEPMADALRVAVEDQVRKLRKRLRKARRGDADSVHDARTTLRRVREGLVIMGRTAFDPDRMRRLERGLHRVELVLGATRDDDVLAADLDAWLRRVPRAGRPGLAPLHALIAKTRRADARALARALARRRHRAAVRRVRTLLRRPGKSIAAPPRNPARAAPTLVRHFLPDEVWWAYDEILAYETRPLEDVDVIHKVRSSSRRLRYALELFDGALPPGVADLVDALRALQDRLGDLHDHVVAIRRIEEWRARGDLAPCEELDAYVAHRVAERDRLRGEFRAEWRALTGDAFRYALSHLVSGEMGSSRPDGAVRLTVR